MNRDEIEAKVVEIVVQQLGISPKSVVGSASFTGNLGADSLDLVEMVMEFENAFNIEIPDEDQEKITTVEQAIAYICEKLNVA